MWRLFIGWYCYYFYNSISDDSKPKKVVTEDLVDLVDVSSQLPEVDGHNFSFGDDDQQFFSDIVDDALKEVSYLDLKLIEFDNIRC